MLAVLVNLGETLEGWIPRPHHGLETRESGPSRLHNCHRNGRKNAVTAAQYTVYRNTNSCNNKSFVTKPEEEPGSLVALELRLGTVRPTDDDDFEYKSTVRFRAGLEKAHPAMGLPNRIVLQPPAQTEATTSDI